MAATPHTLPSATETPLCWLGGRWQSISQGKEGCHSGQHAGGVKFSTSLVLWNGKPWTGATTLGPLKQPPSFRMVLRLQPWAPEGHFATAAISAGPERPGSSRGLPSHPARP